MMSWFKNPKLVTKLLALLVVTSITGAFISFVGMGIIKKFQGDEVIMIQKLNANLTLMTFMMAFCAIMSVAIAFYIKFNISNPIDNLTNAAHKLAMGEVDVYIGESVNNEIGDLIQAFRNLIRNMSKQAAAAEKIASGDLNIKIEPSSSKDTLSNSMILVIKTLNSLLLEIHYLLNESKNENYNAKSNPEHFSGAYRNIIEGVNNSVNSVGEKIFWYEAMLDSIPFLISVTDMDRKVTFVNKPVEEILNSNRKILRGKPCESCWNKTICNTENCGIEKLENNEFRTFFEYNNLNLQADVSYLYDSNGKTIGHIELVQDVTAKSRAADYQKEEVKKLSDNLKLLAEGNLKLDLSVEDGDEYTIEEKRNFTDINNDLAIAVDSISDYIKDISNILNQMAEGVLNVSVMSDYKGDFVEIKDSLNTIITSFNEILNEMNSSADQVTAGSKQVLDGSQALSHGATEQASSIEELTASIMEVASQTKQNAMNANEANQLASIVKTNAANGDSKMQEMVTSMTDINAAYKKISKIIKVIDEIAFQTNILALNAAVEAARAGQHGKGFAVVADEVRNLATRSAKAAKETEKLIEDSLNIVEQGEKQSNETSNALKTIVSGIEKSSKIIEEIAIASDQQANAIAQINSGIEQVSRVVQNNSSTAEEGAAASEELSSKAIGLKALVGKFITNKAEAEKKSEEILSDEPIKQEEVNKNKSGKNKKEINMTKIDLNGEEFGKY